ncbi:MAG: class I SAM-dependent methyltransferase [Patescibacteria group bacterium]
MAFTEPQNNIEQFDLDNGMFVADMGAGSGAYAVAVAKKIGSDGKVYAIEVQKELLDKIRHSAEVEHLFNVEVIWGDIEKVGGTKLGVASMDAVIVSNVLFQAEEKDNLIKEAYRILKANRRVLFVDWISSSGGLGPLDEQIVSPDTAKEIFTRNGFEFEKDIYAGDHHYGMIFRKK